MGFGREKASLIVTGDIILCPRLMLLKRNEACDAKMIVRLFKLNKPKHISPKGTTCVHIPT